MSGFGDCGIGFGVMVSGLALGSRFCEPGAPRPKISSVLEP